MRDVVVPCVKQDLNQRVGRTQITRVQVADSYRDGDFSRMSEVIAELMDMGFYGDSDVDLERKRRGDIDRKNPATQKFFERVPTSDSWLDMVPTVQALDAVYDPQTPVYANGRPTSVGSRSCLANSLDGIGIRSRGAIVNSLIQGEAQTRLTKLSILSLACGAAHPVLRSARQVGQDGGETPHVVLVDYDKRALSLARKYAASLGLGGDVILQRRNILDASNGEGAKNPGANLFRSLGRDLFETQNGSFDVVEALGILEYLMPEDWAYRYHGVISTKKTMAGAVTFLRNAYRAVKPGGILVVGNMLDSHPQLGFTLNVIQWPHIQPRSVYQMDAIFDEAGLDGERRAIIPGDGVYSVYTIRKPCS